jgi:hypothetical protein
VCLCWYWNTWNLPRPHLQWNVSKTKRRRMLVYNGQQALYQRPSSTQSFQTWSTSLHIINPWLLRYCMLVMVCMFRESASLMHQKNNVKSADMWQYYVQELASATIDSCNLVMHSMDQEACRSWSKIGS